MVLHFARPFNLPVRMFDSEAIELAYTLQVACNNPLVHFIFWNPL
jgi:hypothetical protein